MKAFKITFVVLCGLIILLSPQVASGAGGWVVQVSPTFIFNGENVTATVTGIPNTYAFVQLVTNSTDITGNATIKVIDDRFLQLDDLGVAKTNFTLPIDAKNGVYAIHVVYNGAEVTNTTFNVLYDENLYNRYLVEELQKDLDRQNALVLQYGKISKALLDREWQMWMMALVSIIIAVLVVIILFLMFKDFLEYRTTISKRKDGLTKAAQWLLHPPARGDIRPYLDHLDGNIRERMERIEDGAKGTVIKHPFVLFPDPESPYGFGVAELRDDGLNEVLVEGRKQRVPFDLSTDTLPNEELADERMEDGAMPEELAVDELMQRDIERDETFSSRTTETSEPETEQEEEVEPEYTGDIGLVPVSEDVEDTGHFVPLLPDRPKKRSRKGVSS